MQEVVYDRWPGNARGDVLHGLRRCATFTHDRPRRVRASAAITDHGGARRRSTRTEAAESRGRRDRRARVDRAARERRRADRRGLFVRIRPPGGQFGADAHASSRAAPVRSLKVLAGPTAPPSSPGPRAVASTTRILPARCPSRWPSAGDFVRLELTPGRVVMSESGITEAVRRPGGWSLAPLTESVDRYPTVIALPDGGAAIAYASGTRVRFARAAAGAPFGPLVTVDAARRAHTDIRATASRRGPPGECCWHGPRKRALFGPFGRVKTAFAPAGRRLGPSRPCPAFPPTRSPRLLPRSHRPAGAWSPGRRPRHGPRSSCRASRWPSGTRSPRRHSETGVRHGSGSREGGRPAHGAANRPHAAADQLRRSVRRVPLVRVVEVRPVQRGLHPRPPCSCVADSARVLARVDDRASCAACCASVMRGYHYGAADVAGNVRGGSIPLGL